MNYYTEHGMWEKDIPRAFPKMKPNCLPANMYDICAVVVCIRTSKSGNVGPIIPRLTL